MTLEIYPDFLTQKKYDIKYYESPSHFVGNKYVLHCLSEPSTYKSDDDRTELYGISNVTKRLSLNDKISLILYNICFLSYDKFFMRRTNNLLLPFEVNGEEVQLTDIKYKNLLLSIEAATAVVEDKERINKQVNNLKELFKEKTSYELVIPDNVLKTITNMYNSIDINRFSGELFDFISQNYDNFNDGLSNFLFDPNIGFRLSYSYNTEYFYNDINYKPKNYLSFSEAIHAYTCYCDDNNISDKNIAKVLPNISKKKESIKLAYNTLQKLIDRGISINVNMSSFDCWKKILQLNRKRKNNDRHV